MKSLLKKPFANYVVVFFILNVITGILLFPIVDNLIMLIAILIINFFILTLFLQFFIVNHMKPLRKAVHTLSEINQGNYRVRFHFSNDNIIGALSKEINSLARNMSEYSIQEKMQREQLTTIIENTENGIVLIDEKGYIHLVNRKFLTIYGKTMKDYIGYLYYEVLKEEVFHKTIQNAFLYEVNVKNEFTHDVGTEKVYYQIIGVPIFNEKNRLKGAVLVIHDITELKKLELMRKDFVANVSHELRTPITSIRGFAETLLEDNLKNREVATEFLTIIYNESDRMQLLIEDLLTLSRLEQENFQLVVNEIEAEELLKVIIPAYQMKAMKKKISIAFSVEENVKFKADKEKVKQIIINLLDNAIHYTQEQGKVSLTITSTKEYIHIKVSDTGMGIDKAVLPRVFERFYRVDKARSRNTGGTGLGLAIVKHIVDVHDGKIEIDSEINKGTTIHIYLPRK
ncbi:two-component system histidine kinase PnpS [Oceanobacillus sp. Castelsardo]|uniref:two-component system histidine kinase PnpS n=1 Tax=Oceanobacillus sp. Castelsardo TaxID=1851204 RepID=UPI0008383853|nr:ATP-binding protein [Oceanobacillus sp. Castelsardo]